MIAPLGLHLYKKRAGKAGKGTPVRVLEEPLASHGIAVVPVTVGKSLKLSPDSRASLY